MVFFGIFFNLLSYLLLFTHSHGLSLLSYLVKAEPRNFSHRSAQGRSSKYLEKKGIFFPFKVLLVVLDSLEVEKGKDKEKSREIKPK